MKGKQLRKAVLLGMAMSMAVWTTGMAADHSQITDTETITDSNITVANNDNDQGAIDIRDGKNVNVSLTTAEGEGENHDIQINSEGYGILTRDNSTGTITLDSLGNNSINFKDGSGISADSGVAIKLEADGDNTIMYTGDGDHDGINAGANNKGNITLLGTKNEIRVLGNESDGIYTGVGSISDEIMIATDGDNTITAGNNGIDHRGSGDVILTAENGGNIIHAGEGQAEGDLEGDGIRVEGNGDVFLDAKYNKITGHDEGIYTDVANSQINITSTSIDENGIGNYIEGADNGIQIIGRKKLGTDYADPYATGQSTVVIKAEQGINKIIAGQSGIIVTGTNNKLNLQGNTNIISIDGAAASSAQENDTKLHKYVYGIQAVENGSVEISSLSDSEATESEGKLQVEFEQP